MKNHISFCVNNSKRLTFCFVNELQDVLRFLNTLLTKEFFVIVENRIKGLPPKCKQIFVMKYKNEYSNPEISEKLGLSIRTVENQIYIARNVLREYVDSYLCS